MWPGGLSFLKGQPAEKHRKMEAAALLLSEAVPPPVVVNESHLCWLSTRKYFNPSSLNF